MRGLAGTISYLNMLLELYDEYEQLGTICVLEMVRLTGCSYNEAQGHFDVLMKAKEEDLN